MPRPYTKRNSEYWENLSAPQKNEVSVASSFEPMTFGEPFMGGDYETIQASTREVDSTGTTRGRINRSTINPTPDRFSQIRKMTLPFHYRNGGVDVKDAIELCQKAYAHVAAFRNAIDLMSEFANTNLYFEGGTKGSRDFFKRWIKRINMTHLKDQSFREWYRSGNVFLYRVDGKFELEDFLKMSTVYAEDGQLKGMTIPLRYILLSPTDIISNNASTFHDGMYEKILSSSELARLKNPQTQEDKELFEGFSSEVKKQISDGNFSTTGLKIKIDPLKLHTIKFKCQDYEPFAIPFGYPVLEDINLKLEMKRADQATLRSIETAVLLVTMGAKPDEGGINQANVKAMQALFQNGTTGRTIVADYTTKAEYILPDLKKVLGPEKYEVVNRDISEGLQNVIVGEEKYGNTQTKVQVFLDKLNEARDAFLDGFLNPEIKRISKELGFRSYPVAKFSNTEIKDNTEMMRVAVRMAELGVLTPEQVLETIHKGVFPNVEDVKMSQEEYIKERKEGKWMPLAPVPIVANPLDPNAVLKSQQAGKKPKVGGQSGRPKTASASLDKIKEVAIAAQDLNKFICGEIKKSFSIKKLDKSQLSVANELCEKIVAASDVSNWKSLAISCVGNPKNMLDLKPLQEVETLAAESGLRDYEAALYVHSLV